MAIILGAIIETATPPEYIFNIGVFDENDWDYLADIWSQFEPTRYIIKLDEMQKSDGYNGPIWLGAVKDEFGKWYDPNWVDMTPEEQQAAIESARL